MTEPDEAIERLTVQINELLPVESVGFFSHTADYVALLLRTDRAGAAASDARIKALEEAIRDANKRLKDYSDMTVDQWDESVADGGITAWMVIRQELQTVIAGGLARALLKEPDQ